MAGDVVTYKFVASDGMTFKVQSIAKATKKAKNEMGRFKRSIAGVRGGINKLGKSQGLRRTGFVAAAVAGASLKAFGDMEAGLNNVLTLMDTPAEADAFKAQLKSMQAEAVKLGFGIGDASKALFNNVSALGANERSFKAFKAAQKLAIGGVADLSVSVGGIGAIMNAYKDEVGSAEDVANAFFTAQKKGTTTVALLASNIGKVAPVAKQAGVSYKELLAVTAQLTQGGLSTEEATTGLRSALSALIDPSKQAAKVLKKHGIPMGVVALRGQSLTDTLRVLAEVSKKYPDELAKAIPNIRAFTAAASLSGDSLDRVDEIVQQINKDIKHGTGLNKAFVRQQTGFNDEMKRTGGELKVLGADIGEIIAPAIRSVTSLIKDTITLIRINKDAIKGFVQTGLDAFAFITGEDAATHGAGGRAAPTAPIPDAPVNKSEVAVTLKGQPGTVESVSATTSGKGLDLGVNAEAVL